MAKFVNNKDLLREIELSKLSFCSYLNPEDALYHGYVEEMSQVSDDYIACLALLHEIPAEDVVVRVSSYEHVPDWEVGNGKASRIAGVINKVKVNFPAFVHIRRRDGTNHVVLRSHWDGGFENGSFSITHGRLTNRLGAMMLRMVHEYAKKPNWAGYSYIDEMRSTAILQLCDSGLVFNAEKTKNPFAYFTTMMSNSFIRHLNLEKKLSEHRRLATRDMGRTDALDRNEADINRALGLRTLTPSQENAARKAGTLVDNVKIKRSPGRPRKTPV